ncbi:MAG: phosphotransferase, partial [Nitrospiria bacterium]
MVDRETLRNTLNHLLHIPANEIDLKKLPGDASNRTYYRLSWEGDHPFHSFILMVLADPEEFKASEEAVSDALPPMTEIPFINIQKHLLGCKVSVPEIVFSNTAEGWLLLEDLGDIALAERIKDQIQNRPLLLNFYRKAVDELITLQIEATPAPTPPTIAHRRRFDQSLFVWEFDHFIEYGIEKRKGIRLPEKEKSAIRAYFSDIAFRLAQLPPVFTHRDYHSRNLMIQSDPAGFK